MKAEIHKCRFLGVLMIATAFLSCLQGSMIQSSADELENIEVLDQQFHKISTYVQDTYEQFNYKILNADKHPQESNNHQQLSLAQTQNKVNLLGETPLEDNVFVQINSENQFLGSFFGQIFNFVTFGAFKKKEEPLKLEIENKAPLQQNASNQTNQEQSMQQKGKPVEAAPQPKMMQPQQPKQLSHTNEQSKSKSDLEKMISSIDKTFNTVQMIAGKNLSQSQVGFGSNQPNSQVNQLVNKVAFNQTQALSKMNIPGGNQSLVQSPAKVSNQSMQSLLMNNLKKVVKEDPQQSKAFKDKILQRKLNLTLSQNKTGNQTALSTSKVQSNISLQIQNVSLSKNSSLSQNQTQVQSNGSRQLMQPGIMNQSDALNKINASLKLNETVLSSKPKEQLSNTSSQNNQSQTVNITSQTNQSKTVNSSSQTNQSKTINSTSQTNNSQSVNTTEDGPKSETQIMAQEDAWAATVICDEDDSDCQEKKARILDDGVDSLSKYINNVLLEHSDEESMQNVTEAFEKQAKKDDDENQMLTKDKAQLAYEQVFENWNVELNSEQEMKLDQNQFTTTWTEFTGSFDGRIKYSDGPAFMRQLLKMSQQDQAKIQAYKVKHHQAPAQSLVQSQQQSNQTIDVDEETSTPAQRHQKESLFEDQVNKLHDKQDYEMTQALADVGKDFSAVQEAPKSHSLLDNFLDDELNAETNDQ